MSVHPGALRQFVQAVAMAAADPQTQEGYLRHIGRHPDTSELALNVGDHVRLVPQFVELGWLEPALAGPLHDLDRTVTALDADAWHADALATHAGWAEVRRRARLVLYDLE